jgi:hypothetical protein
MWKFLRYPLALILTGFCLTIGYYLDFRLSGLDDFYWVKVAGLVALIALFFRCIMGLLAKPREPGSAARSKMRGWLNDLTLTTVAVGFFVCLPAIVVAIYFVVSIGIEQNPGPFDRPRLEHIVQMARQQDLKEEQIFVLDAAGSLKKLQDDVYGTGDPPLPIIYASRASDGSLRVTIVTVNLGHAGMYGFLYSDKILRLESDPDTHNLVIPDVPGLGPTTSEDKIDDHWWKVFDNEF